MSPSPRRTAARRGPSVDTSRTYPVTCGRLIDTLFPAEVLTLAATPEMWSGTLLPQEEACLSPRAIAKRRREFTAGRVCARAALARLGIRGVPLVAGPDRSPVRSEERRVGK